MISVTPNLESNLVKHIICITPELESLPAKHVICVTPNLDSMPNYQMTCVNPTLVCLPVIAETRQVPRRSIIYFHIMYNNLKHNMI